MARRLREARQSYDEVDLESGVAVGGIAASAHAHGDSENMEGSVPLLTIVAPTFAAAAGDEQPPSAGTATETTTDDSSQPAVFASLHDGLDGGTGTAAAMPKRARAAAPNTPGRWLAKVRNVIAPAYPAADLVGEELCPTSVGPVARPSDAEMNSLVHLYRGDVGRLTSYRQRLDTTTNWAVSITSVLVAFTLGSSTTPHYFFAFIVVLQLFFCGVEARRLTYYRLVRHRCRLIERGMYANILQPGLPAANWRGPLREAYLDTATLIPFRQAFMIRIKRIYSFLITATYLGWIFKILVTTTDVGVPFPWITVLVVSILIFPLAVYAIFFYGEHKLDV